MTAPRPEPAPSRPEPPPPQPVPAADPLPILLGAVADDLRELARLHDAEPDRELLRALGEVEFPSNLGLRLVSPRGRDARALMRRALAELPDPVDEATLDALAADFAAIYLHGGLHASPYESAWLDDDGLVCQEPMLEVRAWYRGHGLAVENWRKRPDDHLAYELEFLAHLLAESRPPDALRAAARFADEHLLRWLPDFAERVAARCATPFFAGVALLSAAYVDELRDLLAELLGEPRPARAEVEERLRAARAAPLCPGRCGPT